MFYNFFLSLSTLHPLNEHSFLFFIKLHPFCKLLNFYLDLDFGWYILPLILLILAFLSLWSRL